MGLAAPIEISTLSPFATAIYVILPVYNEAEGSPAVVNQLAPFAAAHPEYRFTFVDDGSIDGTPAVISAALGELRSSQPDVAAQIALLSYRANGGK